ncbi:effector binding domain-containing protein [Sulfitobacter sp. F26204]|uniref:GyrI-like domain-containing protein n=1 Tax=Sulfitobacter sp. F26204 TaxID=2996014 RepID=UPI00225E6D43|nr:effector binding domain-containing protein [Sulfitobacter sp. F26204]MCX7560946.1 effector binding domain-containing protein [Sulfitobacter sp. F26204]
MSHTLEEEGFTVIGLSKVVRNDDPAAIGALWEAFHSSDVRRTVGADASEDIYCVYHDYEGGFMDPYRMTIGYRASSADAPEGLHSAEVPKQSVVTYEVKGPQPESLISQWQAIWTGDLNRSYLADYDVYDATDPETVSVRVGVRI